MLDREGLIVLAGEFQVSNAMAVDLGGTDTHQQRYFIFNGLLDIGPHGFCAMRR